MIELVQAHHNLMLQTVATATQYGLRSQIHPLRDTRDYFHQLPEPYIEGNGLKRRLATFNAVLDYPLNDLRQMFGDDIEKFSPPLNIKEVHPHA